ncbi:MAG: MFS transporter [Proteobacteria bacterium]|nr:MFS transporter [Pseudomonadota bacterium]MBI3499480.1 MFS transporter [Pseudomonadota bacterium]
MPKRYSPDPEADRSLRHTMKDGIGYAILVGACENYLGAYAVFLEATAGQVAILSTFPNWVGSLVQLVSAWIAGFGARRKTLILAGVAIQAIALVPMIALPPLWPAHAIPILTLCALAYHAGNNLAAPMWTSLVGDLLPERRRGRWFGRRTAWINVATFFAIAGAGFILEAFQAVELAYWGFATVFFLGGLGRLYSFWQLMQVADPGPPRESQATTPAQSIWHRITSSNFVRYSLSIGLMYAAVVFSGPFFNVYMLRELHFTYIEFMGNTAVSAVTQALLLPLWGRVRDSYGNRIVIVVSGAMIPLVPVVWIFTTNYWLLIGAQMVTGAAWSGYALASSTFLYDTVTPSRRGLFTAIHTVLATSFWFVGGLAAAWLVERMPTSLTLFGETWSWGSHLIPMFALSALARAAVAIVTLPRLTETGARPAGHRKRPLFPRRWGLGGRR